MPTGYFRRTLSVSDTTSARPGDDLATGHSLVELRSTAASLGFSLPAGQPPSAGVHQVRAASTRPQTPTDNTDGGTGLFQSFFAQRKKEA